MKNIAILFIALCFISPARAAEKQFFLNIPLNAQIEDAVAAVKKAAKKRQWSINKGENGNLHIDLDHRGYLASLEFYFTDRKIYFVDSTTSEYEIDDGDDDTTIIIEKEPIPVLWLQNLKNDTSRTFSSIDYSMNMRNSITNEPNSYETMEKKLLNLKKLYDNELITEAEYTVKRKELISNF